MTTQQQTRSNPTVWHESFPHPVEDITIYTSNGSDQSVAGWASVRGYDEVFVSELENGLEIEYRIEGTLAYRRFLPWNAVTEIAIESKGVRLQ